MCVSIRTTAGASGGCGFYLVLRDQKIVRELCSNSLSSSCDIRMVKQVTMRYTGDGKATGMQHVSFTTFYCSIFHPYF